MATALQPEEEVVMEGEDSLKGSEFSPLRLGGDFGGDRLIQSVAAACQPSKQDIGSLERDDLVKWLLLQLLEGERRRKEAEKRWEESETKFQQFLLELKKRANRLTLSSQVRPGEALPSHLTSPDHIEPFWMHIQRAYRWLKDQWSLRMSLCLPRQVQETHCSDVSEADNYAEMCRYRFREYRFQEAEGLQEAYAHLSELCHKWIQPKSKSAARIADMLITEHFLEILPHDVQAWVRRNRPDIGSRAVSLAEYILAIKEHGQCSTLVMPPECPMREKCRAGKAGGGIMTARTTNALPDEKLGSLHTWSHSLPRP
ncbi:zinc finger and SCAN domain-containing protein 12-like [Dermochelys coriacea]|uniref:zinc finger and SCAN domain-containing protein 12-like n=1 Tax=Dermochelys coriacea TaxID=27794 RepID=UPI001CA8C38F|nr:zinc finger and SCAN domain-containing protein 12-like [Dermochelys coriacea]